METSFWAFPQEGHTCAVRVRRMRKSLITKQIKREREREIVLYYDIEASHSFFGASDDSDEQE